MERKAALKNYNPYRFLVIFYIVGLLGHIIPFTRNLMLFITPLALFISGITIIIPFIQNREYRLIIFLVFAGFIGYTAEIIGVNTGLLFGDYSYGEVLGPALWGVPFTLILNWIIILAGSLSLSEILLKNNILIVLSSAVFSLIFDFIMEPVAVYFRYWTWKDASIPVSNYITWGIIIFFFSAIFKLLKFKIKHRLPAFLFVIFTFYFLLLRIVICLNILN